MRHPVHRTPYGDDPVHSVPGCDPEGCFDPNKKGAQIRSGGCWLSSSAAARLTKPATGTHPIPLYSGAAPEGTGIVRFWTGTTPSAKCGNSLR